MSQPVRQFDESVINYYNEHFCARADALYRFAFALTLSLDGAKQLVDRTFEEVAANLEQIHGAGSPHTMQMLVQVCFQAFAALKNKTFKEGRSAITMALKPLSIEERAALAAVDVCGLAPADAAKVLKWQEGDLRKFLARARRGLMANGLQG